MKVGITGRNGFIGSALAKRFKVVYPYPRKDLDILFYFGSPSSNIIFDQNIDYSFNETINGFLNVIQYCRDHKIKLVYPSSATVYNKNTSYAHCKAILEEIHQAYDGDVLGFRIFAGYGIEDKKGEYASIVYQFCKMMKEGKRPIIFGDGNQTRDFIYIDDIVDNIVNNLDKTGIIDLGTGVNFSFNEVVDKINRELKTKIKPIYIDKPENYIEETVCKKPCKWNVSLSEGIKKICQET